MTSALKGIRQFVIHHGGCWVGDTSSSKLGLNDYEGGSKVTIELDGDELCWFDHRKEVLKILGMKDGLFHVIVLIKGSVVHLKTDQDLMEMWDTIKIEGDDFYHMWVGAGAKPSLKQPITSPKCSQVGKQVISPRRSLRILGESPPSPSIITSMVLDSPKCVHPSPKTARASKFADTGSSRSPASRRSLFRVDKSPPLNQNVRIVVEEWADVIKEIPMIGRCYPEICLTGA
ncbi:hypothetical protein ACHQM5_007175 [Ranunculus cassubicifolius]